MGSNQWRIEWFDTRWRYTAYAIRNSIMDLRFFQGRLIELFEDALTRPRIHKGAAEV